MSTAKKVGVAGFLLLARKGWGALINLGVMAYLARTLEKSDFGLVAISATMIAFIQILGISGIGEYYIFYKGDDDREVLNAAFWLNLTGGLGITIVILIGAPFWASFYGDARIEELIYLLSVGVLFSIASAIPIAIFRKNINYRPMVAIQTVFGTISQLSLVAFTYLGFGVYSLALPNAIVIPFLCFTLYFYAGFSPKATLNLEHWSKIFSYTKHIIGARVLNKFANEGDTLLIGKLLGMQALGIYDIAFKLANLVNSQLLPIITNITLPVFASNRDQISKTSVQFRQMIHIISFVFFPIAGCMIVFADPIIMTLYGHQWSKAILPFQILCLFAVTRSVSSPASGLYNALGRPEIGFYFVSIFTPIFLVAIYKTSSLGLVSICLIVMILRNLGSLFHLYMSSRLLSLKIQQVLTNIMPAAVSTTLAFLFTYILFPEGKFSGWVIGCICFFISYLLFFRLIYSHSLRAIVQYIDILSPSHKISRGVKKLLLFK